MAIFVGVGAAWLAAVVSEQWTVDSGQWAVGSGQWTVKPVIWVGIGLLFGGACFGWGEIILGVMPVSHCWRLILPAGLGTGADGGRPAA
ncbi:MAG: hypothetical protein M5U34_14965 [Chloroflexi bacterium]|nr:hypothetical protein [Chloroflexota bacterium]